MAHLRIKENLTFYCLAIKKFYFVKKGSWGKIAEGSPENHPIFFAIICGAYFINTFYKHCYRFCIVS
jgi:hypothetical protein